MKSDNYYGMLEDIKKEPELLRNLFVRRKEITADFVSLFSKNRIKRIYFTGSGSPLYVGNVLKYASIRLLGVEATSDPAMLLLNHIGFNTTVYSSEEIVLFCPAESGRAKGQVNVAKMAKKLGIPIVCTTWNGEGILAGLSDIVLLKTDREAGMPTTMGQVMAIYLGLLCFVETGAAIGHLSRSDYDRFMLALSHVPDNIEQTIIKTLDWFDINQDKIMASEVFRMIAYGANIGTAEESSLKFQESNNRTSVFHELEESMHGPLVGIKKNDIIFIFCTEDGAEKQRAMQLYEVMNSDSNSCVVIQSSNDPVKTPDSLLINTDNTEFVDTIEYLVPMQLIAFKIADCLGKDTGIHEPFNMMRKLETSYK